MRWKRKRQENTPHQSATLTASPQGEALFSRLRRQLLLKEKPWRCACTSGDPVGDGVPDVPRGKTRQAGCRGRQPLQTRHALPAMRKKPSPRGEAFAEISSAEVRNVAKSLFFLHDMQYNGDNGRRLMSRCAWIGVQIFRLSRVRNRRNPLRLSRFRDEERRKHAVETVAAGHEAPPTKAPERSGFV